VNVLFLFCVQYSLALDSILCRFGGIICGQIEKLPAGLVELLPFLKKAILGTERIETAIANG
jgi:hypothetical protein